MKHQPRSRNLRVIAKWIALASALGLLARALKDADLPHVFGRIEAAGPFVLLGLLPYLIAVTFDSFGWRRLFASIGWRASVAELMRIRIEFDAIAQTIPAGTVIAESLTPGWLRRGWLKRGWLRRGWLKRGVRLPVEVAIAGIAARKCAVGIAQSVYLFSSFAFGFAILAARARSLPWIVLALSIALFVAFGAAAVTFLFGRVASRVFALLQKIPFAPLKRSLASRARSFDATDSCLRSFGRAGPRPFAIALVSFVSAWLMESFETWLFLLLLGANVSPIHVVAFEASLSLLRSIVFFAPGGIGFQDVGYMAVFAALGVNDVVTVGPAFVVLKRGKEMAWACVGYAFLGSAAIAERWTKRTQPSAASVAPRIA